MLLYHNYNIHILLHHNIYYYDNDYIIIIVFAAYNLPNDRVDVTAKRSYFFPRFHIGINSKIYSYTFVPSSVYDCVMCMYMYVNTAVSTTNLNLCINYMVHDDKS